MKNNFLKIQTSLLTALILISTLITGCTASRIEKNNRIQVPGLNAGQNNEAGKSILVYAIMMRAGDTEMHVKKFRLTLMDNQNIEITHGLSYLIYLNDINHSSRYLLTRAFKEYGYNSINDYIKAQARLKPILPGSQFIALPAGKGNQLFNLAIDIDSRLQE